MAAPKNSEHSYKYDCEMQLLEREEIEEDDDSFEAIDKLIAQGINAGDVKKLQDAGIHNCNGLMMHTKKNLTVIKGLSEAKVDKTCEAAEKIVNFGYMTGSDALLKRKLIVRTTMDCQAGERKEQINLPGKRKERDDDDEDEPVPYSLVKFLLPSFCVYFLIFVFPVFLLHFAFL